MPVPRPPVTGRTVGHVALPGGKGSRASREEGRWREAAPRATCYQDDALKCGADVGDGQLRRPGTATSALSHFLSLSLPLLSGGLG